MRLAHEDGSEGEGEDVRMCVHGNAHSQVDRASAEGDADTRGRDDLRRTDGDPPA